VLVEKLTLQPLSVAGGVSAACAAGAGGADVEPRAARRPDHRGPTPQPGARSAPRVSILTEIYLLCHTPLPRRLSLPPQLSLLAQPLQPTPEGCGLLGVWRRSGAGVRARSGGRALRQAGAAGALPRRPTPTPRACSLSADLCVAWWICRLASWRSQPSHGGAAPGVCFEQDQAWHRQLSEIDTRWASAGRCR
jgi:hypothetical protein